MLSSCRYHHLLPHGATGHRSAKRARVKGHRPIEIHLLSSHPLPTATHHADETGTTGLRLPASLGRYQAGVGRATHTLSADRGRQTGAVWPGSGPIARLSAASCRHCSPAGLWGARTDPSGHRRVTLYPSPGREITIHGNHTSLNSLGVNCTLPTFQRTRYPHCEVIPTPGIPAVR